MTALFKAIPLGMLLTFVIAMFVGTGGSSGGALNVFSFIVEGFRIYWSWVLFCSATALASALMAMMGD